MQNYLFMLKLLIVCAMYIVFYVFMALLTFINAFWVQSFLERIIFSFKEKNKDIKNFLAVSLQKQFDFIFRFFASQKFFYKKNSTTSCIKLRLFSCPSV